MATAEMGPQNKNIEAGQNLDFRLSQSPLHIHYQEHDMVTRRNVEFKIEGVKFC